MRRLAGENAASSLFAEKTPDEATYNDVFLHADAGDPFCRSLLDGVAEHMAVAINNVVQVCEPERVIVQGEYANAGEHFLHRQRELARPISLIHMDKGTQIVYSRLGSRASSGRPSSRPTSSFLW